MRRIATVAIVAILAYMAQTVVFAQDYITEAAQALQHASVYVAPNTEGTDKDTAAKLQARLNKNDNIVLVMLPASAQTTLGTDATTIASRLSDELGNRYIIGLAVGNEVVGYAPYLPSGVATDQMRRAKSVSNDPVTALSTYAQNMHIWQAANPQPKPPPAPGSDEDGGVAWYAWLALAVFLVFLAAILVTWLFGSEETSSERTNFKAPDIVKDLLAKIVRLRGQVDDPELRSGLYQLCVDVEKYFLSSSQDKNRDARFFSERLTDVAHVLEKYVDVQNNQRYYNNASAEMRKGKGSLLDFGAYVLESIRRGNAVDLFDYTVNTKILQAQRYR